MKAREASMWMYEFHGGFGSVLIIIVYKDFIGTISSIASTPVKKTMLPYT
jgi:hypothetical protein